MATNLKVSTDEAIAEIGRLIDEVKNLKTQFSGVGKSGKSGMKASADAINTMKANAQLLGEQMETLLKVVKENDSANKEVAKSAQKTGSAYKQLADQTKKASDSAKSLYITQGKGSKETKKAQKEYRKLQKELDKVDKSTQKTTKSTKGLKDALVTIAAGFTAAIYLSYKYGKELFNQIKNMDSVRYAITQITESAWEYRVSIGFLISLTRDFGVEMTSTSERWVKFLAAAKQSGLSLSDTENIFRSMTKTAAVLGLKTDELKGVYLALEQMLSKGKITTEELRRQLGERLPGAMGIMAASMGVSLDALDKMMKKGEVLSAEVLPGFADAVEIAFGIQSLEKVDTLQAAVGRLEGAWDQFIFNMAESEGPFSTAIKNMLENLTELMNAITFITGDPNQKLRIDVVAFDKEAKDKINKEARDILDTRRGLNNELERLERELQEANNNFQDAVRQEDKDAAQLVLDEKTKALVDYGKDVKEVEKEIAESNLNSLQATVDRQKKIWEDGLKEIEELRKKELNESSGFTGWIKNNPMSQFLKQSFGYEGGITEEKKMQNDEAQIAYAWSLAELDNYKKLLQVSKEHTKEEDGDNKGYKRRIKSAKKYAETNQLLINSLEEQIRLREKLTKDEKAGLVEQMDAMQYNLEARQMVIKLQEEDQIRALNVWRANESQKLKDNLESFKEGSAQYAQQAEQNRLQELENVEEYNEKLKLIHQDRRMKEKLMNEKHDDDIEENIVNRYAVQKQLLVTEQAEHLKVLEDKLKTIRKGGNEEKKILFEIRQIQIDYHNLMIDNNIKQLKDEANRVKTLGERLELLKKIRELEAQKLPDAGEDYDNKNSADGMGGSIIDPLFAQDFSLWAGKAQDFTNEIFGLADAIYEHRIALIQKEIDAEERKYDRLLELAKGDEEETKIIQRNKALALEKLEAKKRREQIKQAKLDKALRITQAIQSTAVAVMNALTVNPWFVGVGLAAIAAATGATQIATISTTPIPSFATGGVMEKDGKALINDGGNQEYVERGGSILTTGKTNALVDLKEGDIIHKDFETLQRKSLLLSLSSGGESITEKELNLAFGIKEEIQKGFKNAQVNSKVTVLNEQNNYRDKMSLWGNS